jgi:hypothetical protein
MGPIHVYVQTFATDPTTGKPTAASLHPLLNDSTLSTRDSIVVYLSSLHLGTDARGISYLHLNNDNVDTLDDFFADVQARSSSAVCPVEIRVMLGGAGGAYTTLFADFEPRYALLHNFLKKHAFLTGIDLDIEEVLDPDSKKALTKVQRLLARLHEDFVVPCPSFRISMAPIAESLTCDSTGLGGFSYTALLRSVEGSYVTVFNVQAYGCYAVATFQAIVQNGFLPKMLVFGMLGNEYGHATAFTEAMTELENIANIYCDFGGAILWEYGDTAIDGVAWEQAVRRAVRAPERRCVEGCPPIAGPASLMLTHQPV